MEENNLDDILMEHVIELLDRKDFKKKLIAKLNEAVDMPLFNEKVEKKILNRFYDILVNSLKELEV